MPGWTRLDEAGWRWRVASGAEGLIRGRDWSPPASDGNGWHVLQRWGSRVSALDTASGGLFVKWYGLRHAGEALRFLFVPSRPESEWRMNARLAASGIPVAPCLALGEKRRLGLWIGGILVLKAVTPPLTLATYLETASPAERRWAADAAAFLVARLHEQGYCHHDLHGDNILVDAAEGLPKRLVLIDLHETTRHTTVPERQWLADLARLNGYTSGSRSLRLRFWWRYARARRLPRERLRAWLAEMERETRRMWERHYRKRGESIERY